MHAAYRAALALAAVRISLNLEAKQRYERLHWNATPILPKLAQRAAGNPLQMLNNGR